MIGFNGAAIARMADGDDRVDRHRLTCYYYPVIPASAARSVTMS